jgi:uncharacterized protein YegL
MQTMIRYAMRGSALALALAALALGALSLPSGGTGTAHANVDCGPMDVAFVVDTTGSMGGAIENVKAELSPIIDNIKKASGGDAQLALVTFKDNVVVEQDLASGNNTAVADAIAALSASGGAGGPEASDEALNTVLNGLDEADRAPGQQTGDFDGAFRPGATSIVILVTDALPGGFDDAFTAGVDDANAHTQAKKASAAGILIAPVYVPTFGKDPTIEAIMQNYANETGGLFIQTESDGTGTADGINAIIESCGRAFPKGKDPQFQNLWLCSYVSDVSDNCNAAGIVSWLGNRITSRDPKCTGFPNFLPPEECPFQELGAWEFEVRFNPKYINVQLSPAYFEIPEIDFCQTNYAEGIAQIACNTKGKSLPLPSPFPLAFLNITPTADTYSLLRANQDNGIVVQLINQDCNLADTQGHAIPIDSRLDFCNEGAVTIRYLEGDVHADCRVDVRDQQQIAFRWGARLGQLLYNENYDLEPSAPKLGDGDIDAKDLQTVYGRHGSTCKDPHPPQPPVDPKAKVEPPLDGE